MVQIDKGKKDKILSFVTTQLRNKVVVQNKIGVLFLGQCPHIIDVWTTLEVTFKSQIKKY